MPGAKPKRTIPMPGDWIKRRDDLREYKSREFKYPSTFKGRGIVTCAGGKYFTPAWVLINILRMHGCKLPIEIWHIGPEEVTDKMREVVEKVPDVKFVDAFEVKMKHNIRKLGGWESKPLAIMYSSFEEVLFLDSDNVPTVNPEFLFEDKHYKDTGAVFWPDYEKLERWRSIWQICDVEYKNEPEFETGQILVDKRKCWKALNLTMRMNEYSEFFYKHIWGDKDTFHMGWKMIGQKYSMPPYPIHPLQATMCQLDFEGRIIFQHRNLSKFKLGDNIKIAGFKFEEECFNFLRQLSPKEFGEGIISVGVAQSPFAKQAALSFENIVKYRNYKYKREGKSTKILEFLPDGSFGKGLSKDEWMWYLDEDGEYLCIKIVKENGELLCSLRRLNDCRWRGYMENDVRYIVDLKRK